MALQVWLPDGSAQNQGLLDLKVYKSQNIKYSNGNTGKCLQFDGNPNQILSFSNVPQKKNNFTWACWTKQLNRTSTIYDNTKQYVISEGRDCGTVGFNVFISNGALVVEMGSGDGTGSSTSTTYSRTSIMTLELNIWYHICCCVDDNTVYVYVNGSLIKTISLVSISYMADSNSYFTIGKMSYSHTATNNYFPLDGCVSDIRVYDNCISPREVKEISKGMMCHYTLGNVDGYNFGRNLATKSMISAMNSFYNATKTYNLSENTLTITTTGTQTTWGNGVSMGTSKGKVLVPWNKRLFISFEINVPVACRMNYDVNNYANSGSSWSGNDNDDTSLRIDSGGFSFTETNTWLYRWISYSNTNSKNTNKVDLYDVTGFGVIRAESDDSITYKIRNFKYEILPADAVAPTLWTPTSEDNSSFYSDNSVIYDISGFNNHGSITDMTKPSLSDNSPRYDFCCLFENKHYILGKNIFSDPQQVSTITINFWVNQTSGGAYSTVFSWNGYGGSGIWLGVNVEGCGLWSFISGSPNYCKGGSIVTNTWNMVTYIFNKGEAYWYLNGQPTNIKTTYTTKTLSVKGNFIIGDNYAGSTWNTNFNGKISDFRMYATALSDSDVLELYNSPITIMNTGILMTQGEFKEE